MSKKVWQSIGVCLLAGFLTVQAHAAPGDKAAKSKAEEDVKSAVDAINKGQFEVVSVVKAEKEGWYNVVLRLPNGKNVGVSVNGNSSLVKGYVDESEVVEEDNGSSEPAPTDPVITDPIDIIDIGDLFPTF